MNRPQNADAGTGPAAGATPGAPTEAVVERAIAAALRAPSIFNTQPWRWNLSGGLLQLWADRERQLGVTDPEGRMLTLSCGVALHHALVTLVAHGLHGVVARFPDDDRPDLLAQITLRTAEPADPSGDRLYQALLRRHTDRRPFGDQPVPDELVDRFRREAESQGIHLEDLHRDQMVRFQVTAARAGELSHEDEAYQAELAEWTHRPVEAGDGVPAATAVPESPRRVPLREFFPAGESALDPGAAHDVGARFLVLWSEDDDPEAWLAAGETMSAILLEVTASGLAASPMSDVVEVPVSRTLLGRILGGIGHPHMILRVGHPSSPEPAPDTPRRTPDQVITTHPPPH